MYPSSYDPSSSSFSSASYYSESTTRGGSEPYYELLPIEERRQQQRRIERIQRQRERREQQRQLQRANAELGDVLDISLRGAQLMLENGANTARVEKLAFRLGTAFGAETLDISATPTFLMATTSLLQKPLSSPLNVSLTTHPSSILSASLTSTPSLPPTLPSSSFSSSSPPPPPPPPPLFSSFSSSSSSLTPAIALPSSDKDLDEIDLELDLSLSASLQQQQTKMVRIKKFGVNLNKVSLLQDVARRAACGELDKEGVRTHFDSIEKLPKIYSLLQTSFAVGLACAGFCTNLGGDWRAILSTFFASFIGQSIKEQLLHLGIEKILVFWVVSTLGSLLSILLGLLFQTETLTVNMLASVLLMIPGSLLVGSVMDFFRSDSLSGVSRAVSGWVLVLSIGGGLWTTIVLCEFFKGAVSELKLTVESFQPHPPSYLFIVIVSSFLATGGFAVLFDLPKRTLVSSAIVGSLANTFRLFLLRIGFSSLGAILVGGISVGLQSQVLARVHLVPTSVFNVPGFIPMVPGTTAFRAILFFAKGKYPEGAEELFRCVLLVTALAAGIGWVSSLARLFRTLIPSPVAAKLAILRRTTSETPTKDLRQRPNWYPFSNPAASYATASYAATAASSDATSTRGEEETLPSLEPVVPKYGTIGTT